MQQRNYDEQIRIEAATYIYRVQHRIMEGDCQYDHGPIAVNIPSLNIDKYPVTNRRYKQFLDATGYRPKDDANFLKHWQDGMYPKELADHPVVWVSPSDAKEYAKWAGCRLPKDTEWQWAACGHTKYKWPWGNRFDANNCNGNSNGTTPVDRFPDGASEFGCMDMTGNVWEWVDDVIDDGMHLFTFIRGGSFYKAPHMWHAEGGPHPTDYHLKFQLLNEALNRNETVGFRCVKEVDGI